jgi:hypothetical protein
MSIRLSIFFWQPLVMEKGRFSNTQLIIVDYKVFVKLKFFKRMSFCFYHKDVKCLKTHNLPNHLDRLLDSESSISSD